MQEMFNKRMDTIVEDLEGVAKSTDDFLVYGKNQTEHDFRLRKLLDLEKTMSPLIKRSVNSVWLKLISLVIR